MIEIIIDGYNLIGSDKGLRGELEHKRNWLVQQLVSYRRLKDFDLTLVFDGWIGGRANEVEEKKDGIRIIYSRQGEKADAVIVRMARGKGNGCAVVTSDREVRTAVEKIGAAVIYAAEFNDILRNLQRTGSDEDDDPDLMPESFRHGNPHRLSKAERQRLEILKKLRP